MRVLDWITFIYALGFLLTFTYLVFSEIIFNNWYMLNLPNVVEDIIGLTPIIYPALLIFQYIIRDKVRILPWK
tara:strand:- start:1242 stop:1460 length:219 start_codon:yes stop_codon:yes gene_type:complete